MKIFGPFELMNNIELSANVMERISSGFGSAHTTSSTNFLGDPWSPPAVFVSWPLSGSDLASVQKTPVSSHVSDSIFLTDNPPGPDPDRFGVGQLALRVPSG